MEAKDLKILTIIQKVDNQDDLLYPFYKWLKIIAGKVNFMNIVCLFEGQHQDLPANVKVWSLGKDKGALKISYLINLYKYVYQIFKNHQADVLFVHMNEIYILLLWPLAKIYQVPIIWWKAHGHLSKKSKLALHFVTQVATSSASGFPIDSPKRIITGQGADTDYFSLKKDYPKQAGQLIYVGRISPVKKLETLVEALNILINQKHYQLEVKIYGSAPLKEQQEYLNNLKAQVNQYHLTNFIEFVGSVPHVLMNKYYQSADIFINPSGTGSLDKTVLEAMSCGLALINANPGYQQILKDFPECQFDLGDYQDLAAKLEFLLNLSAEDRRKLGQSLRDIVVRDHNVYNLCSQLINIFLSVCPRS